ncbi:FAD-dependent monooxygenase [Nonomuraea sp. NPDC004297]
MRESKRVLVVGLGIAGMSAALRLHRSGWTPVIVERAAERRTGGYFIGLFPEGRQAVRALGLTDVLHTRTPERKRSWEVGRFGERSRGVGFLEQPGDPDAVLRGDIEQALWSAIDGHVEVRFDTVPAAIRAHAGGASVTLRRGGSAAETVEETVEDFDLVIGADGLRSTVRELVFGAHERFMKPLGAVICAFQMSRQLPEFRSDDALVIADTRRSLWVFPLDDCPPTALFTYRPGDVDAQFSRPPVEVLQDAFAGLSADGAVEVALEELAGAPQHLFDSVHYVEMPSWHRGRVALVGDAAWCLTLYSGMGATAAMSGAALLGDALDRHEDDVERALHAWEQGLRPFIRKHRRRAGFKAQFFVPSTRLLTRVRSAVLTWGARRKLSTAGQA